MNKNINTIDRMIQEWNKYIREAYNDKSKEYPDNSIEDIIKNIDPFKAYYDADNAYSRIMLMKFSTGDNLNDYKPVKIPGNGKTVKDICYIGRKFIESYSDIANKLDGEKNKFEEKLKLLEKAEKESKERSAKASATKESFNPFLILENAYLSETDLCFCKDFSVLFEETASNNNDDKKDDKPFKTEVTSDESNSNNDSNNSNGLSNGDKPYDASSSAFTFLKNMTTIIISALSVALTVAEQRLYMYKNTIKSVIQQARKSAKKPTNTDDEEKPELTAKGSRKVDKAIKKANKKIDKITSKYGSKAKK